MHPHERHPHGVALPVRAGCGSESRFLAVVSLVPAPASAQDDCDYPDDWDDIGMVSSLYTGARACLDDWTPWMLHDAARFTGQPGDHPNYCWVPARTRTPWMTAG